MKLITYNYYYHSIAGQSNSPVDTVKVKIYLEQVILIQLFFLRYEPQHYLRVK